jgi:hypothetical protein
LDSSTKLINEKVEFAVEFARNPKTSLQKFKPFYLTIIADPNVKKTLIKKATSKSIQYDISKLITQGGFQNVDQRLIGNPKQTTLSVHYKIKLYSDNMDEIMKSKFQEQSENSKSFLKMNSTRVSIESPVNVQIINSDDSEDEEKEIKSNSSSIPDTPLGYGSEDDDLIDGDLLNLSASGLLSKKNPKDQNYAVLFNLTDELLDKSHKIMTVLFIFNSVIRMLKKIS